MSRAILFCAPVMILLAAWNPQESGADPTFQGIPGVSKFVISWEDANEGLDGISYPMEWLLGAVRSVTTGDYDQDGDEDVLVSRFANERILVNQVFTGERQPQFVLYENLFTDASEQSAPNIKFRLRAHALGWLTRDMFTNVPEIWEFPDTLWGGSTFPGLVTADFNSDGWPDVFAGGSQLTNGSDDAFSDKVIERSLLFINCRQNPAKFVEVGALAGFNDVSTVTIGTSVADFDNNGRLDIFMACGDGPKCTDGNGAPNRVYAATTTDASIDCGGTTLYFPVFTEMTTAWNVPQDEGLPFQPFFHFGPTAADYDGDGWIDLYVGYRAPCPHCPTEVDCNLSPNVLLRNTGGSGIMGFEDVAEAMGTDDNGNAYGCAWGDVDNDGRLDLLFANNFHCGACPPIKDRGIKLFRNNGGNTPFTPISVADFDSSFAVDKTNNGVFFFDFNLDGRNDFYVAVDSYGEPETPVGNLLFRQETDGTFEEAALDEGLSQVIADDSQYCPSNGPQYFPSRIADGSNSTYADFDKDGDLDLFAPSSREDRSGCTLPHGGFTLVFKNLTREITGNHYITLRLKGRVPQGGGMGTNLDAIGSIARVYAGGQAWSQQVCAGGQDGSTWPFELTFGLGAVTSIDSIVVDWQHTTVAGVPDAPYHQRIEGNNGPITVDQLYPTIMMPTFTVVPNDEEDLQVAVNSASIGGVVLVRGPTSYPALSLRPGVRVEGVNDGGVPVIYAQGQTTAVTLSQANNSPGTALVGFAVRNYGDIMMPSVPGTGVSAVNGGTHPLLIDGCVFDAPAVTVSDAINASQTSVIVRNTTISYPAGKSGRGVFFIDVPMGHATLQVSGCHISYLGSTIGGQGIYVQSQRSGSVLIEDNSLYHFDFGIDVTSDGLTPAVIRRNLLLGPGIGTIGIRCYQGPHAPPAQLTHNLAWGHTENYDCNGSTSTPAGNLEEDPRVCGSDMTLNLVSPCARFGNDWGAWIGSRKYVSCASGATSRSIDLTQSDLLGNGLTIVSDLEVSAGDTLSIEKGIAITFDDNDEANRGVGGGPGMNEILVRGGRLQAEGTDTELVEFTASSPGAGLWQWIHVADGGKLFLKKTRIHHPHYGVYGDAGADTISLNGCLILNCDEACVSVNNSGVTPTARLLVVGGTIITGSAWAGIHFVRALQVQIDGVAFGGGASSMYGIFADTMAVGASEAEIKNCTINTYTAGCGIYVNYGSPSLRSNAISGSKWGIRLFGPGSPRVEPITTDGPATILSSCTTGLYSKAATPIIDKVTITSPTGGTGLYNDGTSAGSYTRVTATGGAVGFNANSTGSGTFRNGSVTQFTVNGFKYNAPPGLNLGNSTDGGLNSIHSTVASGKWVLVKTCPTGQGAPVVSAQQNYWNGAPDPTKLSVCVDYSNWLSNPPNRPFGVAVEVGPVASTFAVVPNPFSEGLTFTLGIAGDQPAPVSLRVYDVAGRLVRVLATGEMPPGDHLLEWDGRNFGGVNVGSGMYFARLWIGKELITRKLLKLP